MQIHNKLHVIQPSIAKNFYTFGKSRKDQVVLTRCRIGHSRTTHSYILKSESAPECIPCQCPYTMQHILIDCADTVDIRNRYSNCSSMSALFNNVAGDQILQYLKDVNLYSKM